MTGTNSGEAGYRRSAGSPRGEARRRELLDRVVDDLAVNGMVDFSLRRAARAAGTTHKVLLYYFDGVEDLLRQAVAELRDRRAAEGLARAGAGPSGRTLADRVLALWPALSGEELGQRTLDQAIGLALYDTSRHGDLARGASRDYVGALVSLCPAGWEERRKAEVAEMVLATLRGLLIEARTGDEPRRIDAGLEALRRALVREEQAG